MTLNGKSFSVEGIVVDALKLVDGVTGVLHGSGLAATRRGAQKALRRASNGC